MGRVNTINELTGNGRRQLLGNDHIEGKCTYIVRSFCISFL